jgi:hypothetical protein
MEFRRDLPKIHKFGSEPGKKQGISINQSQRQQDKEVVGGFIGDQKKNREQQRFFHSPSKT